MIRRGRIEIVVSIGVLGVLTMLLVCHFTKASSTDKDCDDPNWLNTHITFNTEENAASELGDDLYIYEFSTFVEGIVPDECKLSYELELKENGELEDRSTWAMFAMEAISESENWSLYIFFDCNDTRVETLTDTLTDKTSINGISVSYCPTSDKSDYLDIATFNKAGRVVYISCDHCKSMLESSDESEALTFAASLLGW